MKGIIALTNPKFPHNVGAAIRACACWGYDELVWSGKRCLTPEEWKADEELNKYRIPREERMKGYSKVKLTRTDRFKDIISAGNYTPVAIEVRENVENLFDFIHPENPMYIFGPEDGSIPATILQHCHRFMIIPTAHCLNLSCAINVVLADRASKLYSQTGEFLSLQEERGFIDT